MNHTTQETVFINCNRLLNAAFVLLIWLMNASVTIVYNTNFRLAIKNLAGKQILCICLNLLCMYKDQIDPSFSNKSKNKNTTV